MKKTILSLLSLISLYSIAENDAPLKVAVASNFKSTLEKISAAYEKKGGINLIISSSSSGVLFAQIINGAPYDIFFSADANRPLRLEKEGLVRQRGTYAYGRIVFWLKTNQASKNSLLNYNGSIAIPNPELAPYGAATIELLKKLEINTENLIYGSNVNQVFSYVETGNVSAGFIALSQALEKRLFADKYWLVPEPLHSEIEQQYIISKKANPLAENFIDWVNGSVGKDMIQASGYRESE